MLAWQFMKRDEYAPVTDYQRLQNQNYAHCALDALACSPGPIVRRIDVCGYNVWSEQWRLDASQVLVEFIRWYAIGEVFAYWPGAPEMVRQWLLSMDDKLRKPVYRVAVACISVNPSSAASAAEAVLATIDVTPYSVARFFDSLFFQAARDAANRKLEEMLEDEVMRKGLRQDGKRI